ALPTASDGTRYELVDGELRLQHAASDTHGTIQANLARLIGNHLFQRNGPCRVVTAPGVSVRMNANHNKRIPDLGITCDPNHRGGQDMPSPKALIEILSPSNKVETLANVWAFTTIPSLEEVLIVSSFERAVFLLARAGDQSWP
ncbi:MAG: Uma2 family endonuclease, partial [Pseudomonadota bacterium]